MGEDRERREGILLLKSIVRPSTVAAAVAGAAALLRAVPLTGQASELGSMCP